MLMQRALTQSEAAASASSHSFTSGEGAQGALLLGRAQGLLAEREPGHAARGCVARTGGGAFCASALRCRMGTVAPRHQVFVRKITLMTSTTVTASSKPGMH